MSFKYHCWRSDCPSSKGHKRLKKTQETSSIEAGDRGEDAKQADLQQAVGDNSCPGSQRQGNDRHTTTIHSAEATTQEVFFFSISYPEPLLLEK